MYYLKINDKAVLIYYCRNCGHEDDLLSSENICVSKTNIVENTNNYSHIINEFTKLDNTLPRTTMIKCPNQECKSNMEDISREVLYIRYDDINMKYIYMCTVCDTTWKTEDKI